MEIHQIGLISSSPIISENTKCTEQLFEGSSDSTLDGFEEGSSTDGLSRGSLLFDGSEKGRFDYS